MVLGGLFSSDEKDLDKVESEISDIEEQIQKVQGEKQLQDLKKQKRKELKQKKKQLKKEEFEQTKAGKVLSSIGNQLENISEQTENRESKTRLNALADGIEKVDGDGKGDTSASKGIGLMDPDKGKNVIELEGDVTVEGDINETPERRQPRRKNRDRSMTGSLSEDMEDIIK